MARNASPAAAAESTPPESAQIARPAAIRARISSTARSTNDSMDHDAEHPQTW